MLPHVSTANLLWYPMVHTSRFLGGLHVTNSTIVLTCLSVRPSVNISFSTNTLDGCHIVGTRSQKLFAIHLTQFTIPFLPQLTHLHGSASCIFIVAVANMIINFTQLGKSQAICSYVFAKSLEIWCCSKEGVCFDTLDSNPYWDMYNGWIHWREQYGVWDFCRCYIIGYFEIRFLWCKLKNAVCYFIKRGDRWGGPEFSNQ